MHLLYNENNTSLENNIFLRLNMGNLANMKGKIAI